tara:strand:+ start:21113 stop:21367 length:255 start_codon:yes stop_codon:yes gene_type:complete
MKNKLNYRKNRVHYNEEETEKTETVDRETGEVTKVANADSGVEEKKGSAIVGLMILIFMLVMMLAIIYFWYWVFKNIFLILRGK